MRKDVRTIKHNCDKCGKIHHIEIDFAQLNKQQLSGQEPVIPHFKCPDIARMYRAMNYNFDTRISILKSPHIEDQKHAILKDLINEWGEKDFDNKLKRYKELDLSFIGIPEEYYQLLWPIISAYSCGMYYPAMTSSGALGERILNRLILKTRDYFKSSQHYKKIYRKDSFDQWDNIITILTDWRVISNEVAEFFTELKRFRNDSIHYNAGYDFEQNSQTAVKLLAQIIDKQFNYTSRKDLFWVFHVPGEIWLRSNVAEQPFVKEFILPHCLELTPFCEPRANPPIFGRNTPLKPITDEEFIEFRKNRTK